MAKHNTMIVRIESGRYGTVAERMNRGGIGRFYLVGIQGDYWTVREHMRRNTFTIEVKESIGAGRATELSQDTVREWIKNTPHGLTE